MLTGVYIDLKVMQSVHGLYCTVNGILNLNLMYDDDTAWALISNVQASQNYFLSYMRLCTLYKITVVILCFVMLGLL